MLEITEQVKKLDGQLPPEINGSENGSESTRQLPAAASLAAAAAAIASCKSLSIKAEANPPS